MDIEDGVINKTFNAFAGDDGYLETTNFAAFLDKLGYNLMMQGVEKALDTLDPDATGRLDKLTFLAWFEKHGDTIQDPPRKEKKAPLPKKLEATPLLTLNNAMLDAKKERKKADDDAKLLANRLAHLRAEEQKAARRIEEAERRAFEIEKAKQMKQESRQRFRQVKSCIPKPQKSLTSLSAQSTIIAKARQREKDQERKFELNRLRNEKDVLRQTIEQNKAQVRASVLEKKKSIQKQQEAARRKRREAQEKREKEQVARAQKLLAEEHKQRILTDQRIKDMELEEARLIEKLQATQERQREAYGKLETVL